MITNIIKVIAHGGEVHETAGEATSHLLSTWYIALPIFILAVSGLASIVYLISRKVDVTLIVVSIVLLVSGFTMYSVSAIISVVSITLGLMGALALTLISLTAPTANKKGPKK